MAVGLFDFNPDGLRCARARNDAVSRYFKKSGFSLIALDFECAKS
jgi:hypothetical protein